MHTYSYIYILIQNDKKAQNVAQDALAQDGSRYIGSRRPWIAGVGLHCAERIRLSGSLLGQQNACVRHCVMVADRSRCLSASLFIQLHLRMSSKSFVADTNIRIFQHPMTCLGGWLTQFQSEGIKIASGLLDAKFKDLGTRQNHVTPRGVLATGVLGTTEELLFVRQSSLRI